MKIKLAQIVLLLTPLVLGFNNRMDAQEVAAKKDSTITVEFDPTHQRTTIGYGTQPTWMVSGALSTVKGTDLQKTFATNLVNTLFGRLSGVTLLQGSGEAGYDGAPGAARGNGTYGVGRGVLTMIDGFENSLEQFQRKAIFSVGT